MSHLMRKENIQRKYKAEKYNETGAAAFFFATLDIVVCLMMWLLLLRILSLSRLSVTLFLHREKFSSAEYAVKQQPRGSGSRRGPVSQREAQKFQEFCEF